MKQLEITEIWDDMLYTLRLGSLNETACHCGTKLK